MQNRLLARGFTLIELLIVVAIIAILAAIAVPNFLEAQTRAKVSRAKSDMRSLATGIESYRVDNNKYPASIAPNSGVPNTTGALANALNGPSVLQGGRVDAISSRFIWITTPIAYISSVFSDPFVPAALGFARDPNNPTQPNIAQGYDGYDYIEARTFYAGARYAGSTNRGAAVSSGAEWHVVSAGPDGINAFGGGTGAYTVAERRLGCDYDPTNGTISAGDIVRLGSGAGPLAAPSTATNTPQYNRVTSSWLVVP